MSIDKINFSQPQEMSELPDPKVILPKGNNIYDLEIDITHIEANHVDAKNQTSNAPGNCTGTCHTCVSCLTAPGCARGCG